MPLTFKLHPGRVGQGTSLPSKGRDNCASSKQPDSEPVTFKISRAIQNYHNPDPLVRLIGPANEAIVKIDGIEYAALIDSGAQLSALPESLVNELGYTIKHLNTLLEAEGTGGRIYHVRDMWKLGCQFLGLKPWTTTHCSWLFPIQTILKEYQSNWEQYTSTRPKQ